ncbi:MAG: hypothetical protein IPM45_17750 [Acidimicrobiales bacterium]|nr:hypothetical protein [Acidimicrobiales bacterium]
MSRFVDEHAAAAGLPLPTGSPPEPAAPPAEGPLPGAGAPRRATILGSASVDGDLLQARYTDGLTVVSLFRAAGPARLEHPPSPARSG